MKKIIMTAFACALAVSVTGCGSDSSSVKQNPTSETVFSHRLDDGADTEEEIVEKANQIKEEADAKKEAAEKLKNGETADSEDGSADDTGSSETESSNGDIVTDSSGQELNTNPFSGNDNMTDNGSGSADDSGSSSGNVNSGTSSGKKAVDANENAGRVFSQRSDLKDTARNYVGKDLEDLKKAIGEPIDFVESDGRTSAGRKNAVAAYDGFMVTCESHLGQSWWKITAVR